MTDRTVELTDAEVEGTVKVGAEKPVDTVEKPVDSLTLSECWCGKEYNPSKSSTNHCGDIASHLLIRMEEDDSYRQPDYAELRNQSEGWPKCAICGGPFIPSRSTEDRICGDVVANLKVLKESRPKPVGYCSFCNAPLPDGSRKSRLFCSDSHRVAFHYATKGRKPRMRVLTIPQAR